MSDAGGTDAALLSVRGLTVRFDRSAPVCELSFDVHAGETVAIVGESGSGKSLTALALMGLLPRGGRIGSGAIRFGGADLATAGEAQLRDVRGRDIAMIFQEPMTSLNPVMTVGRQIAEVLVRHQRLSKAAARVRAVELLDLVRVADPHLRVDDFPHRLSGGMRQRVMIAIAVACGPKLLIADEPTTALDVTIQAQVLDLIDKLRRDFAMGLILITHDLGIVGQWADRVIVMYAGRKVEEALPEPLFADPRHPYTQGLIAASPRVAGASYREAALREIPGNIVSALGEAGCPFAPRCPHALPACRLPPPPPAIEALPGRFVACPVLNPTEAARAAPVG